MLHKQQRIKNSSLYTLGSFLVLLAVWGMISLSGLISPVFLPSPPTIVQGAAEMFSNQQLIHDILASIYRIFIGFLIASVISLPLGCIIGLHTRSHAALQPLLSFVRYIPPPAFVPLFILWFGIGDLQKILLIVLSIVPYLTLLIVDEIKTVNPQLVESAYTLGLNNQQVVWRVILPHALPGIWNAMRLMVGAGWTFVILAEAIAATSGLGHIMITAQRFVHTADVIVVMLIIGCIGMLTDRAFALTHKRLFHWSHNLAYDSH